MMKKSENALRNKDLGLVKIQFKDNGKPVF